MTILRAQREDLAEILALQKECYLQEAAIYEDYKIPPLLQTIESIEKDFKQNIFLKAVEELKRLQPTNKKLGHINNSRDWIGANPKRALKHQAAEINFLNGLGFEAENLDLKTYFGKEKALAKN